METNGFIKIHRKMLEWGWYNDLPVRVLFQHLLLRVNWKEGEFHGIKVMPGERITSIQKLSEECLLTPQQIKTALTKLKSTNEITYSSTNTFTHIKLIKWADYQNSSTNEITNEQQTSNKRITTIEEGNKERKKEDTTTTATDLLLFFNSTTGVNLKLTDKKREQIKNRLKTFSIEEIKTAIKNRMQSKWHIDNGWTQDWDSLFCNDEKIDKMLNIKSEAPIKTVRPTFNFLTGEEITYND